MLKLNLRNRGPENRSKTCVRGRAAKKQEKIWRDQVTAEIAPHFLQILLFVSFIWPQLRIGILALELSCLGKFIRILSNWLPIDLHHSDLMSGIRPSGCIRRQNKWRPSYLYFVMHLLIMTSAPTSTRTGSSYDLWQQFLHCPLRTSVKRIK